MRTNKSRRGSSVHRIPWANAKRKKEELLFNPATAKVNNAKIVMSTAWTSGSGIKNLEK
jgi:hypothetical protein